MKDARQFANYKRVIGQNKIILLATVGSIMLGLESKGQSDIDEMGVCIESPKQLLGFAPFEQDVYRTAEDRTGKFDTPSEPGDIDLTVYGLRKFVRMALSGNPNIMSMFYVPQSMCSIYTRYADELQALAPALISKVVGKAFLGYLTAQKLRLSNSRGQRRVNRPELEENFGYDTKYAMHATRLGMQGYRFMQDRKLTIPMHADDVSTLRKIRDGKYDYLDAIDFIASYERGISDALAISDMPDKPDYNKIEQWLLSIYERTWYADKATPQQQGDPADTAGKDKGAGKADRQEIEAEIPF